MAHVLKTGAAIDLITLRSIVAGVTKVRLSLSLAVLRAITRSWLGTLVKEQSSFLESEKQSF